MLHTSDFRVLLALALAKEMSLRTYWWWLGMWKVAGRMWWVCSSYLVATGTTMLPFSLLCTVLGRSAPSHTHLCCAMHKEAAATHYHRAAALTPGCCEYPSASRTLWKSTLPSLASPIVWTPKLHCLLHGLSYVPQIESHSFFFHSSHLRIYSAATTKLIFACCTVSLLTGLYVKLSLQTGVHRGREQCGL